MVFEIQTVRPVRGNATFTFFDGFGKCRVDYGEVSASGKIPSRRNSERFTRAEDWEDCSCDSNEIIGEKTATC